LNRFKTSCKEANTRFKFSTISSVKHQDQEGYLNQQVIVFSPVTPSAFCHFLFLDEKKITKKNQERNETARSFHRSLIKLYYYCDFSICFSCLLVFDISIHKTCYRLIKPSRLYCHSPQYSKSQIEIPTGKRAVIVFRGLFWLLFTQAKSDKKMKNEQLMKNYKSLQRRLTKQRSSAVI
jgi:hypothetical protein